MENDKKEQPVVQEVDEKEKFFEDMLDDEDDGEKTEDEKKAEEELRRKNKDAEEARKRREAEEKAAKDKEAAEKAAADKAKAEEEAKTKTPPEKKEPDQTSKDAKTKELGSQLQDFKKKYPDVELKQLDNDPDFKEYIDGKLLGNKNFTSLYESYLAYRVKLSGKPEAEIRSNYEKKARSSSGSSVAASSGNPPDIFSQDELRKVAEKLPLMSRKDAAKIEAKIEKSIAYYDKKK